MGHNLVIRLEILNYVCLLRTTDITQFWGTVWKHRTHILLLFKHFGILVPTALLWLYILFSLSRKGLLFFLIYTKRILSHKIPHILIFCSIEATNISIFLLPESTWRFYKAQFVPVPKPVKVSVVTVLLLEWLHSYYTASILIT